MPDIESDIRATADDLVADSGRLHEIEREKGRLDVADPRMADLAAEAERIARRMVPKTVAEGELVEEAKPKG